MASFRSLIGVPPSTASTADSALVIIDAQNEYAVGQLRISNIDTSRVALASLLEKYRAAKAPVVHVVHATPAGAPVFTPGTELAEELKELTPIDGESVVTKQHPGSFTDTDLQDILKASGRSKVVLTGYMAHVCVSTTARQAAERGWDVLIAEDAVGDRDIPGVKADELTRVALLEIADAFGTIVQGQDISSPIAKKSKRQPAAPKPVPKALPAPRNDFPLTHSLTWPLLDIISLVVQNFSPVGEIPRVVATEASMFSHRICGGWVEVLPELAREAKADQLLSPAIKTLAVSILARGGGGRAPMSDALAAHTSALESLGAELSLGSTSSPNMIAASIMCLFLSEALQAFFNRRNNFLADQAWTSIPFSFYTASPLQSLFTDVFPLAAILGTIDGLCDLPADQALGIATQTVEQLIDILHLLSHRDQTFKADARELPTFPAEPDSPLIFPTIIAANYSTHLWAFELICIHNIIKLTSNFPCIPRSTEKKGVRDLLSVGTIIQLACWSFKGVEFLLQDEFKLFGAASITLPLKTACDMFRAHDEYSK
ncbi:hypothetical protein ACJ41O_014520 [Fusarium nematophilum]